VTGRVHFSPCGTKGKRERRGASPTCCGRIHGPARVAGRAPPGRRPRPVGLHGAVGQGPVERERGGRDLLATALGLRRRWPAPQPAGRLAHVAAGERLPDEGELHAVEERRVPLLRPPLAARQRRQVVHLVRRGGWRGSRAGAASPRVLGRRPVENAGCRKYLARKLG
jgi:hypothetical protein